MSPEVDSPTTYTALFMFGNFRYSVAISCFDNHHEVRWVFGGLSEDFFLACHMKKGYLFCLNYPQREQSKFQ